IQPGQKYALVGLSGGGKTTICNLLPRFYETSEGKILLDGIDIKNIKLKSLRQQIGIVQQDVFLFAGTIKENIAYGKIDATDEEIINAAKLSEIHEDILKMPQGYDTVVGERGIKLSGGQKQRVSIARCFLKNPPILILDEATSALDTATEFKIQKAFDALSKGRTTLIIAHRLSTIKNADCISVIGDKQIKETGTHSQLMALNGIYSSLHNGTDLY
ncbi:MAG: ATP-binding cassette domain-containing protein, partial [Clostridia bacterium]|nr:ATP-binding cassette domain-containing protein [Clostridia bacterium]